MRFTLRPGSDPVAIADRTMLAALGMPQGGALKVGDTHIRVAPGQVTDPTSLLVGPNTLANTGALMSTSVEVSRGVLPSASIVVIDAEELPAGSSKLASALQATPVSPGDLLTIEPGYLVGDGGEGAKLSVAQIVPGPAGLIGAATVFTTTTLYEAQTKQRPQPQAKPEPQTPAQAMPGPSQVEPTPIDTDGPTRTEALLAGLDNELDLLTGWLKLFAGRENLAETWGLPNVAGVVLEAPLGCGGLELVQAAAERTGAHLHVVSLDLVFKPTRLLDLFEKAIKETTRPCVIYVDRIEAVAGEDGMSPYVTQVAAIMRWFLDTVADEKGLVAVLGVSAIGTLDPSILSSPLLPRTLRVPPPDSERRGLLFEASLAHIPSDSIDFGQLSAKSAGFSGADIVASVLHASATAAGSDRELETADLLKAIGETAPSLSSGSVGQIPSYGFERVAGLDDVKRRLTESVIWPMTRPEQFQRLGIEPPRGVLLHGPPGTGKTFVVKALAHEAGAAFFPVKGAELLDKFVGESERAVREVFSRARAAAPSILFFDELDALAPVRGSNATSVSDSVVASLLTEIDGVGGRGQIMVIGATNRKDLIDPALLRSGRFEVHLKLGLPETAGRRALLNIVDIPFTQEVDLDELAERTEGLSFADLTGLLREAALQSLRANDDAHEVSWEHLEAALTVFHGR